jgi:hypothetical protein
MAVMLDINSRATQRCNIYYTFEKTPMSADNRYAGGGAGKWGKGNRDPWLVHAPYQCTLFNNFEIQ